MLRHFPFYDLLSAHSSPEWTEGTAALLVLRLFDDWIGNPTVATLRDGGIPRLRSLIGNIANPEVRHLLGDAVTVLRKVDPFNSSFAAGPLLAYAQYLDETQWYALAVDVLATVLETLSFRDPADFRLAATTYERLGYTLTQQLQVDEAARSHDRMRIFAELCSDHTLLLKREMYRGIIQTVRGNLEEAELLLRAPIEQARKMGNRWIECWGRRERASTLLNGARYNDALHNLRQAYTLAPDRIEREWITGDIAACMMGLGHTHIARPILQHLTQTAQRTQARVLARANLLEIAVMEGDEIAFYTHWEKLDTRKSLHVSLYIDLFYAQGIDRWQGYSMAVPLYTAVAERAKGFGAHGIARHALAHL